MIRPYSSEKPCGLQGSHVILVAVKGAAMSGLDSRLERVDDIERKLARRPEGWTTGELAREYGVDPSTIFRDLAFLESRGTGLFKQGRRYILDHRSSFHLLKL